MPQNNEPNFKKITFGLFIGSFISFCNLYLFQPLLPLIADHYNVTATHANWVLAAATLTLAFSLVPWAICSESIGRRKVMLFSLYASPVASLMILGSDHLLAIIIARGIIGISLAGFISVAVAYMAEEFTPEAFMVAVGSYIGANSLGGIVGRIFGGVIGAEFGWKVAVFGMMSLSFIIAILVTLWVPPQKNFTPKNVPIKHHVKEASLHLKNPILWIPMLIGGLNFSLFVNLYTVMGFRLVAAPYLLPVSIVSMIFLCYLSGTVTSYLSGIWARRFPAINGIILGVLISFLGMMLALIPSLIAMFVALLLISSGAFFAHSLAYAWVSSKATIAKASATALYLVHYYVGGSLGGFFLIYCWQHGAWPAVALGGSAVYLLIFILSFRLRRLSQPIPVS